MESHSASQLGNSSMQPKQDSDCYSLRKLPKDVYHMGVHPLARDSRGSLEVFKPADYSSTSSSQPTGSSNLPRQYTEDIGRGNEYSEQKERENRSKGWEISETPVSENVIQQPGSRSQLVPPNVDARSRKDHEVDWPVAKQFLSERKYGQGAAEGRILANESDSKPSDQVGWGLPETGVAERAAGWGLVLKTDLGSGRVDGVRTRTSEEEKQFIRTSEERKSLTLTSGTSVRTSEESDFGSDTSGGSRVPRVSRDVLDALETFQQTFVIADGTRPDLPIMYASAGFFKMTGYTSTEVIGRNCRFLQGSGTDPAEIMRIRKELSEGRGYCGRLLNYKKDGTPFWNLLTISPIKDDDGSILKFIGMQVEVSKYTEGFKEKALRPNGLPESLIKYDARQKDRATLYVTELVQAMKDPQPAIQSVNQHMLLKSFERGSKPNLSPLSIVHQGTEHPSLIVSDHHGSKTTKPEQPGLPDVPEKGVLKMNRSSGIFSLLGLDKFTGKGHGSHQQPQDFIEPEILMTRDEELTDNLDDLDKERLKEIRRGIDLATTLERIEKNFVITDPRLPDNPIIFASDNFLELTEYTREEILGRNCRFLQGPETDPETVRQIREAIRDEREITVQLLNYTKSGRQFWNLFHLQPMRDQKGELQYFTGVQLDGTEYLEPLSKRLSDKTAREGAKTIRDTAVNVNLAVRDLPDGNLKLEDLWAIHSKVVLPKPHKINNESWKFIRKIHESGERVRLKHFRPLKPLGFGDTGSVHLVELRGTGEVFAMKAMEKSVMLNRNKVHRACAEREILGMMDHPFVPTLYASFETRTHVCLITDFCSGGELFLLLERQPKKVFPEDAARFYAAEVIVALEYLHCQGVIYRDLKPENVLLQKDGHVMLSDFDLSFLTSCNPQLIKPVKVGGKRSKQKNVQPPVFMAEPVAACNSFVGTEEYIAPEVISGAGHSSSVDWWAVGILLYEMLYGRTPFRGKTRQKTFANILHKDLTFPRRIPTSLAARQLINGLLHRDPGSRLGSQGGANEIKKHPFFRDINWTLIRCMRPPSLENPMLFIGNELDRDPREDVEWDEFEASNPVDFF
uniref:non-specific serine/threonine protein kinase n=1 Tax=Osmunda sp. BC-2016 TaxID=1799607 RepID=A0A126X2G3_9MONI|nr:putative LOV domain-containing protein [Osmunda sp. BC-2016]